VRLTDEDDHALLGASERVADRYAVFYRRHVEAVLRFYARRGLDAATAADLTAETFAAAYLARRRFRPEREGARPWLLTIAARRHADAARRGDREARALRRLGVQTPPLTDADLADYGALADAVDELPVAQRDAVHARVIEDHTYAEAARRLGAPEATVRKRVSRGLAHLRLRLGEDR
jgi:RNA polymerase sigma-70 factor (ECF subfamily)